MFTSLSPGAIGIRDLAMPDAIALAAQSGFAGVDFGMREAAALVDAHGLQLVRDLFAQAGVRPGYWGLPLDWRNDERYAASLPELPRFAALGRDLGCPRAVTVMWPGSNDRPFDENFAWHVARLRPAAEALRGAGCWLGIEFIGPQTFRAQYRHEFIHTLAGTMELARAIGTGNVGVLLDAWHLYTAGEGVDALDALTPEQIVAVHVNDAPAGIPRDALIDTTRALPLETGVMPLVPFMRKLQARGYDGPVTPEPFSQRLDTLAAHEPAAAAREAARSMRALWDAAGLG